MSTDQTDRFPLARDYLTMVVPFSVAVGAIYLLGYWGSFSINALEFIGLTDVVKVSVYALAAMTFSLLVGGLIGTTIGSWLPLPKSKRQAKVILVIIGLIYAAVVVAFLVVPPPHRWGLLALVMSPLSILIANTDFARRHLPGDTVRVLVVGLAVIFPSIAMYKGSTAAQKAISGRDARFIDISRTRIGASTSFVGPAVYLGMLGNFHFAYEREKDEVAIFKISEGDPLFFSPARGLAFVSVPGRKPQTPEPTPQRQK